MTPTQSGDFRLAAHALHQPMKRALEQIRSEAGVSLAFGGPVNERGAVILSSFAGPTVGALPGTELAAGEGLGGKAAALQRGITLNDYFDAQVITHRYDAIIRAEGLKSLVAVPVIVQRQVVAIIYGAFRNSEVIGGRIERAVELEARALEQAIVVREFAAPAVTDGALESTRLREQLRDACRTIRTVAGRTSEPETRETLTRVAERMLTAEESAHGFVVAPLYSLTTREKDVLGLAGAGLSNRAIADTLGLTVYTVKGYMKSAMAKVGGRTRLEAVVTARSKGLIP
ncbi:LuxR C-terminal-related transcriptional regulator [Paenarthrobacter sp. NPDC057981]|uniref:LuxR C-terminal-related transcriptional regulator n=1 Tax=Paenarthrobacter sp. NPDC057981 TaxID=3346297 RepID=UPI0036DF0486